MTADGGFEVTRLGQVAQPVNDIQRAVAFYRDILGARHLATFDPPGLAFFDIGGVRLMLDAIAEAQAQGPRPGAPLYFRVPDIEAACAALEARGVTIESAPHLINRDDAGVFGVVGMETWMAFFRDPDQNILAVMSEVAPA
ncbi:MAG: VOC family protein [Dehalococcoidia bacterium]|nr:VOC family protein [Dehalococcoidia bacterium]